MKFEELKGKSQDELSKMIKERKKELFNLRFQRSSGELEKTNRFKEVRREIAQILTYVNQQEKAA